VDKGGGRHGHHVCVRSVVGSLLSLLTLTHWCQGRAGQLPPDSGGRTKARGGGKGGGVTPGDKRGCGTGDLRDNGWSDNDSPFSSSSYEDDDADIRRRGLGGGARRDPDRVLNKKYLNEKKNVMNIASVQQINLNNQNK